MSRSAPLDTAARNRFSLQVRLQSLVLVCVLPALIVAAIVAVGNYRLQRSEIHDNMSLLARKIAADVDRELSGVESGLRVLATSSDLAEGDFKAFHQRAQVAVKSQIVYNYILTNRDGLQLLNTLVPYGEPLPASGTPEQLRQVFDSGVPVLTDMFVGPVTKKFAIAIGVPVYLDDSIAYSLNIGLAPDAIGKILDRHKLPAGWVARILDGSGAIVARSPRIEQMVGHKTAEALMQRLLAEEEGTLEHKAQDGVPMVTSFCRSSMWNWSVAVSAPKAILDNELYRLIAAVVAGLVAALTLGVWLAARQVRRIVISVRGLNDAAQALCLGKPVELPRIEIKEADSVGMALMRAAEIMGQVRHRAYHDALTGLANRALFEELLLHQFSLVVRSKGKLAILALDLDGFKAVNDEQGHAMGDEVLKIAAKRMTQAIRSSDTAARIGGDEFLVMLCDDDQAGAMQMAERLVAALSLPYPGVKSAVSASIGVAVYPQSGNTIESLIESADNALYQAKNAGKKRAAIFQK